MVKGGEEGIPQPGASGRPFSKEELEGRLAEYRALTSLGGHRPEEALNILGILIDGGEALGDLEAVRHAITLAGTMRDNIPPEYHVQFNYNLGNAWVVLVNAERHQKPDSAWDWDSEPRVESIRHYRLATRSAAWDKAGPNLRCMVLTNLGNGLSHLGRIVEALPCWNEALLIQPFGMAQGSRGYGYVNYGRALFKQEDLAFFFAFGCRDLRESLKQQYLEPDARQTFDALAQDLERRFDIPAILRHKDDHKKDLGSSPEERAYREWSLANGLFLNPLNDLTEHQMAAADSLLLPAFVTKDPKQGTALISMFNQLKQEFATARWLLFSGSHQKGPHFSDRNVDMLNPLDYPVYGLAGEQVRLCYRSAYSILDKIAFFLNSYLGLGVPDHQVWFQHIWYKNGGKKRELRPEFQSRPNWPMRGLFWLARDLYDPILKTIAEPDAQQLDTLRNALEHRFLKLQDNLGTALSEIKGDPFRDEVCIKMGAEEFERKTLRLLRMARAAVLYLALAMHQEEQSNKEADPRPTVEMLSDVWEDDWKGWPT